MIFARYKRIVKCALLALVFFTTAMVLLQMILVTNEAEETLFEQGTWRKISTIQMLKTNFQDCIIHPSKIFVMDDPHRENRKIVKNDSISLKSNMVLCRNETPQSANYLSSDTKKRHPLHDALNDFVRLCDKYDVKATLIEPSMLFCMLTKDRQTLLLKRRLNLTNLLGSENVLTFAIFDEVNATKLLEPEVKMSYQSTGFHVNSIKTKAKIHGKSLEEIVTHLFYIRHPIVIHVVVFYGKSNYHWHSEINSFPQDVAGFVPVDSILFSQAEAIYERFFPVEISAEPTIDFLYLPSDPQLFLHEIKTSRFLECNKSHSFYVNKASLQGRSSGLSEEKFKNHALVALRELKFKFRPFLMTFWIFGGTLLGKKLYDYVSLIKLSHGNGLTCWYRECRIIKYTGDVDFATWAKYVDDSEKLITALKTNKFLTLKVRMGMKEEALELRFYVQRLMVDLFFMYEADDHYWVAGHVPSKGYYFPYNYPKFTLCSADLLGHKVQVPCDTKKIIFADYGQDWDKPVSSWIYDLSPKNMGNSTYWNASEKSNILYNF